MPDGPPGSVLFACGQNCIRSPMAEGIMRHHYGHRVHVASCGVTAGEPDPFVAAVMDEIGVDMANFEPQSFDDLEDTNFDLVITMSPRAHHQAMELTRTMAMDVEYWPTHDPSLEQGNREQILDAYRKVRDEIADKLRARFGKVTASGV